MGVFLDQSWQQAPVIHALGFSRWKREAVRLCFAGQRVVFVERAGQVPERAWLAVWGMHTPHGLPDGVRLLRLEDGFLRSVGLGADLIRPLSLVVDSRGMYFDATQASDLEVLLETGEFDEALLARARALRERIVQAGLTKYNVGSAVWQPPVTGQLCILVPGQVETDASIAFGAPGIRRNLDLLRAVREANPDAYVVYKPHPDVVAGLRAQGAGEDDAARWCDEVVVDAPMDALLSAVDEVHVLTSLAGFEALLRGKRVTCYGQPFYAGWGLTHDVVPLARRTRRLTLDELVAGCLILYPRYLNYERGMQIPAEDVLDRLQLWRTRSGRRTPWWRHLTRMVLRRVVGVR
ncbi:MAG: beta-3-deoxy-D-manno-oct-2-ulosonic acid transferase [Bryobacteraceae bacterium]